MAKRLIECMFLKAQPEMIFAFTQYDFLIPEISNHIKLFGITRDLSPTKRYRPNGLAVIMLNHVIGGSLHKVELAEKKQEAISENLTMAAFQQSDHWTAAIVNANPDPQTLQLAFPDDHRALPDTIMILDAKSPFDTNEDAELVKIKSEPIQAPSARIVQFTVPAWGFVVLTVSDKNGN